MPHVTTFIVVIIYEDRFKTINIPEIVFNRFAHASESSIPREMCNEKKRKIISLVSKTRVKNSETLIYSSSVNSLTGKL